MASFDYKNEYARYKRYYLTIGPTLEKPVNRAYTTIIFSFLAVSLFSWYAIRPTMETIFTLKREIADKTEVDKKMEDKISALIEANAIYENVQDQLPILTQALPTAPDELLGVKQIQRLATDSGVVMTIVSVPPLPLTANTGPGQQKVQLTKVSEAAVNISVGGTYNNIKSFLNNLSGLRRVIRIDSITLSTDFSAKPSATTSAQLVTPGVPTPLRADLKLTMFYLSK